MLRSNNGTYWKSARVHRKNNFNRTNVVDDVNGDIQIVNLFKDKYERLFNSVQCSKEESELMKTQIASEVVNVCNTTKTCESSDLGYEPANLTVHPPPKTVEGGFIFFV